MQRWRRGGQNRGGGCAKVLSGEWVQWFGGVGCRY